MGQFLLPSVRSEPTSSHLLQLVPFKGTLTNSRSVCYSSVSKLCNLVNIVVIYLSPSKRSFWGSQIYRLVKTETNTRCYLRGLFMRRVMARLSCLRCLDNSCLSKSSVSMKVRFYCINFYTLFGFDIQDSSFSFRNVYQRFITRYFAVFCSRYR
jgi:hypothetical protein